MKTLIYLICFFWLFNISLADEPMRTWTSSDGRTLKARFVEKVGSSSVKIENAAGKEFTLPKTRISPADWKYVEDVVAGQDARSAKKLFDLPVSFKDQGKGGIIITSIKGDVRIIQIVGSKVKSETDRYEEPKESSQFPDSLKEKQVTRNVIVGESIPVGSTIVTGTDSEADLLLSNGSLAKLRADSKLVLNAFWQKNFEPSKKKVSQLEEEISSSRVALGLEMGDLVVEVKKMNKASSFMIESPLGATGIRGTQFGLSVDPQSAQLAVLKGNVDFKDANQKIKNVITTQEIVGTEEGVSDVKTLPETKKNELASAVADSKKVASQYDLTRLSNIVDGYGYKPNYIAKSALGMELIWCPPGSFIRGEGNDAHPVILTKGFYLGKYEVTQEQYIKVVNWNPSSFKGNKLPVENVSWIDAMAFCRALNQKEVQGRRDWIGWEFVLPTEAQWEYACRAGTSTNYSWGDEIDPKLANYRKNNGINKTSLVGAYPSNSWGFYDMHGNVFEWCADRFGKYQSGLVTDPTGPASGSDRVVRGGSWVSGGTTLRSAKRNDLPPGNRGDDLGFRVGFQKIK